MGNDVERILAEALALPENERARLAGELLASLDSVCDDDAQSAWAEEIRKRFRDLDAGAVKTIPWADARRSIVDSSDRSG